MNGATRRATSARPAVTLAVIFALGLALPDVIRSEVSVNRASDGSVTVYFEPSEAGPWTPVREGLAAADLLNPAGDEAGDGWPSAYDNVAVTRPECAWSTGGEDAEILFAWHDGEGWSEPLNLSEQAGADEVPVVSTDDWGNVFVAWRRTRNSRQTVFFRALAADDLTRTETIELTARSDRGRRPALVLHDEAAFVLAEELSAGGAGPESGANGPLRIVIDRLDVPRDPVTHVVDGGESPIDLARELSWPTTLSVGANAEAEINSEAGALWATWIDAVGVLGWTERTDGEWTDVQFMAFDPAAGSEAVRQAVREIVLGD